MQTRSDSIYRLPEVTALLAQEENIANSYVSRVPTGHVLFLRPRVEMSGQLVTPGSLKLVQLSHDQNGLTGDVRCAPNALPWEDNSFQCILAQHALETIDDPALLSELARVLAPEGTLLITGFNPLSLWWPWLRLQVRRGLPRLRSRWHVRMIFQLDRQGLAIQALQFMGPFWAKSLAVDTRKRRIDIVSLWRGAYLLVARKRRDMPLTLNLSGKSRTVLLRPGLAGTPSHRVKN